MTLEKYKWKSRILLVSTPNYKDKIYLEAKKKYQTKIKDFHKRYVKLICKINKKEKSSINLIGFDGKSKMIMDKLNYKIVFKIIDKMPLSKKSRPINLSLIQIIIPKPPLKVWDLKTRKKLFTQLKLLKIVQLSIR